MIRGRRPLARARFCCGAGSLLAVGRDAGRKQTCELFRVAGPDTTGRRGQRDQGILADEQAAIGGASGMIAADRTACQMDPIRHRAVEIDGLDDDAAAGSNQGLQRQHAWPGGMCEPIRIVDECADILMQSRRRRTASVERDDVTNARSETLHLLYKRGSGYGKKGEKCAYNKDRIRRVARPFMIIEHGFLLQLSAVPLETPSSTGPRCKTSA